MLAVICTCAAPPVVQVASREWARASDHEWMVRLAFDSSSLWWHGVDGEAPAVWTLLFAAFTEGDSAEDWALAAAVYIARFRRRSGRGPTFSELFEHLLPDTAGLPEPLPEGMSFARRRQTQSEFRRHVAIDWRRRGLIDWDHRVTRSLRVGRVFRQLSRERQLLGSAQRLSAASKSVRLIVRRTREDVSGG